MANTENIEAKLCAYIDGELDAQGRAEIEKHLAANPQHRGLIAELSKQRQMLRALPREMAPDEIMEVLQGQLERAGLLGDDKAGEADASAMRINRWPQIMAAAAVVFLAIGLVGIIYFVLPRQTGDDRYAVDTLSTTPTVDGAAGTTAPGTDIGAIAGVPSDESAFARREASEKRDEVAMSPSSALPTEPPVAMKVGEAPAAPATPTSELAAAAPAINNDVFGPRHGKAGELDDAVDLNAEFRSAQERLFSADLTRQLQNKPGGIQQNSVVLFVCSSDNNAANSEVTNYLVSNNIQWEAVADGPPAPLDANAMREMHLSKNAPARVESKSMTFRQATQSPDVTIEQTVTLPPAQQPKAQTEVPLALQREEQTAVAEPATQATPVDREMIQQRAGGEGQYVANVVNAEARRQRLIIARNMTPKQAQDLNGSLLKQSYVQSAACYPAPTAGTAPTTQDLTLATLDKKAANLTAEADGLSRSRANNDTPATQEAAALVDTSKDATTAPAVLAETAPLPPSGAAVDPQGAQTEVALAPTTAPAADPAALALAPPPTTTGAAFADEHERVDVVIVLQDDQPIDPALMPNAAPATPGPETQPAEPPAAAHEQGPELPAPQPPVVDSPAP